MKNRFVYLIILTLITGNLGFCQDTIDINFVKKAGGRPVSEKKGKFIETKIRMADSTICFETREILTKQLIISKCFKDDEPAGRWILSNRDTIKFDSDLRFSNNKYNNIPKYNLKQKRIMGNIQGKIEAPVFPYNVFPETDNNFMQYIAKSLTYPDMASEKGIQGQVVALVIIDESGTLKDPVILHSVDPELDSEALRVILSSPRWTPAKVDGKPIKTYMIVPINFALN